MELKLTVLLFMGALLCCGSCLNWMAGGNFTQENFSILMGKINAFDRTASFYAYTASATTISNELNTLWAPAWNVVIVYYSDGNNYDSVMYGYGFNGHWLWFNGIQISSGKYISFIIWKDYNCVTWYSYDPISSVGTSTFASADSAAIFNTLRAASASRDLNDIWMTAQDIQAKIPTAATSIFQDKLAFTVIASPSSSAIFFSRFCVKDYSHVGGIGTIGGAANGYALIMQMRAA